jgi:hypothetical protein
VINQLFDVSAKYLSDQLADVPFFARHLGVHQPANDESEKKLPCRKPNKQFSIYFCWSVIFYLKQKYISTMQMGNVIMQFFSVFFSFSGFV